MTDDDIVALPVVGIALPPLVRHVTQASIDAYARASGDHNPIHVDPAFAATGPYGRTIAHGLMTLAFVGQLLNRWSDGAFDRSGQLDATFLGPIFADDTVVVAATIESAVDTPDAIDTRLALRCSVGERAVLIGTADLKLPLTLSPSSARSRP